MSDIVGRTRHGEISLDQMASLMPGMAELMVAIGHRFHILYFAGLKGNWKLAAYQASSIRKLFSASKVTRPKYAEAMDKFTRELLEPISAAIREQNVQQFESAIQASIAASDQYHRDWGYEYIRFRMPSSAPLGYDLEGSTPPTVKT